MKIGYFFFFFARSNIIDADNLSNFLIRLLYRSAFQMGTGMLFIFSVCVSFYISIILVDFQLLRVVYCCCCCCYFLPHEIRDRERKKKRNIYCVCARKLLSFVRVIIFRLGFSSCFSLGFVVCDGEGGRIKRRRQRWKEVLAFSNTVSFSILRERERVSCEEEIEKKMLFHSIAVLCWSVKNPKALFPPSNGNTTHSMWIYLCVCVWFLFVCQVFCCSNS